MVLGISNFAQLFEEIEDHITIGSFCVIILLTIIRPMQTKDRKKVKAKILKTVEKCKDLKEEKNNAN